MRLIRFIILYLLDRFVKVKNFEVSKQNIVPILYNVINKNTSHDGSTPAERNQTGDILNAFVVMNFHRARMNEFLCHLFLTTDQMKDKNTIYVHAKDAGKHHNGQQLLTDIGSNKYKYWLSRSNQKSTRQGINLNNEEQQKPTTSHVQPLYGYNVGIWNGNSPALSSLLGHNGQGINRSSSIPSIMNTSKKKSKERFVTVYKSQKVPTFPPLPGLNLRTNSSYQHLYSIGNTFTKKQYFENKIKNDMKRKQFHQTRHLSSGSENQKYEQIDKTSTNEKVSSGMIPSKVLTPSEIIPASDGSSSRFMLTSDMSHSSNNKIPSSSQENQNHKFENNTIWYITPTPLGQSSNNNNIMNMDYWNVLSTPVPSFLDTAIRDMKSHQYPPVYGNDFTHTSVTENNNNNQYLAYGSDYYSPSNGNEGGCINNDSTGGDNHISWHVPIDPDNICDCNNKDNGDTDGEDSEGSSDNGQGLIDFNDSDQYNIILTIIAFLAFGTYFVNMLMKILENNSGSTLMVLGNNELMETTSGKNFDLYLNTLTKRVILSIEEFSEFLTWI